MAKANITIGYTIDKTGLNELKKQLSDIRIQASSAKLGGTLTKDLKEASIAADKLEDALDIAWNNKLNQLNLSKFQNEIKKSGTTVNQLMNALNKGSTNADFAFENLTRQIATTNLQLKTSSKILDSFAVTFKNTVRYGFASSIFNNLADSVQKAYNYTIKLDSSLNDIRIVSDKSAEDMERFANNANKAAKALGKSTLDYTQASTIYYQQGLSDEEVKARTETTLKAANVTQQASEDVSEQLTSIWNGYKVSAEEAELYIDKVAAVAAATAADLEELSTGMSKVASAANIMGVDIDQLNAQLATVVSVTRQAPESVGTAFKTIYARMGDIEAGLDEEVSLGSYTKQMSELGFNVLDAEGKLRDMGEVIEEIGEKWTTLSREQQVSLSQVMAGTRQYNNLLSLFDNWDMYTEALNTSKESAGELQRQQDIYMESTKAHLKQLSTEAERTYSILFNQDTVKGFSDILTETLKQFNDYIEGIGGGFSALLNLGSQIAMLYSKQISQSIIRQTDNIKKYWDENKRGVDVIKKLRENVESQRESQLNEANTQYSKEYLDAYRKNTDEVLNTVEKAYKLRKGLTDTQINEIQNEAKIIASLKDKEAYYRSIKDYAEKEYSVKDIDSASIRVDLSQRQLDYAKDSFNDIIQLNREMEDLYSLAGNTTDMEAMLKYEDEAYDKKIKAQSILNELILGENLTKEQRNKLEKINDTYQDGYLLDEKQIEQLTRIKLSLIRDYNKELQESKQIYDAFLREEKGNVEEEQKIIEEKSNKINNILSEGEKNKNVRNIVENSLTIVQGLTAVTGAISIFNDENATGADKANAAWQGTVGSLSAISNYVLPGSGIIVQGIGSITKNILEATGAWDNLEDMFKTSEELLNEVNEQISQIRQEEEKINNEIQKNNKAIKEFEEIEGRFNYLQSLAEKGLLTDDLQQEYQSYLEKVQQYNENAEISYDNQGNLISNNTQLMSKTIEQLKEINKLELESLYSDKNWEQKSDVFEKQVKAEQKVREEAIADYASRLNSISQSVNLSPNIQNATLTVFPAIHEYMGAGNNSDWQTQINNIDEIEKKARENIETVLNQYPNLINESNINEYRQAIDKYITNYIEELKEIKIEYNSVVEGIISDVSINSNDLINVLKYGSSKGTYNELSKKLDENVLNQILSNYIDNISKTGEYIKKGGLDELKQDLIDFESNLNSILSSEDNGDILTKIYSGISGIDKSKYTSQEYEDKINEEIVRFLDNLSKSQYEKIKPYLSMMFNLESLSTEWTEEGAKISSGSNQVTFGESIARKIGNDIASLANLSGENKEVISKEIEQFLQNSLNETDLENLDTATFVNNFISYLNRAIELSAENGEKLDLTGVLNRTLSSMNMDSEEGVSNSAIQRAKDLGYTEEALEGYTEKIQENNEVLEENQEIAEEVALKQMELTKELKETIDKWDSWEEALKNTTKDSVDYYQILGEIADSLGDVFDVPVSTDFVEKNFDTIKDMLNGNVEAFEQLQNLAAKDYVANLDINADTSRVNQVREELNGFIDEYSGREIGFTATLDDSNFVAALNQMMANGELTEKQVNEYLAGIGYQGKVGYEEGPETTTESEVYGEVLGKDIRIGKIKTKTKTQVPYLESITKTSSSKSRASAFKGSGATKSSSSGGSGGGSSSKPNVIDSIDSEKDRYHDINIELELISNNLNKLEKQKDKLFGADLIENLNEQLKLLNEQIKATEEKIKIAQKESQELRNKLSKSGVSFNKDGTIANYSKVYDSQLKYVNSVISKYNSMSTKSQEKYQDTVDAAKENFDKLIEDINRYDELISNTIPELQENIQDAIDEQIDLQIEKFNMEIEIRLNLAEAERDWNEFKRKVIDEINEEDILKNASAKLLDFYSYYKDNNTGSIQSLSKQIQNTLEELRLLDTIGKSNVYGDNRTAALEDLKNYYNEITENLTNVLELQEEINESYSDMMDEAQDKFNEQIDYYNTITDLIEHDMDLISLVYGENSYSELASYYDKLEQNNNKQLDFLNQQKDFWANQMKMIEESGNKNSEEWQKAKDNWLDAVNDLNSAIESSIKNLQDKYSNAIQEVFQNLNNKVTNGLGLDYINEQWTLIKNNSDQYLDTVNSIYNIQSLENKYLEAMNNTDSLDAQEKIKEVMDAQLGQLKEKDKLTQYDVDRANKIYEITLKQIALQEAQQNKTTLRLRRDTQGNYSYQYVADNDQISQIQEELQNLYNSLYNFDKDAYNNNLNQAYDIWVEFQEKMAQAAQINDPEERARMEALYKEQYGELINNLVAENENIRLNLQNSAFADLAAMYIQNANDFENMTNINTSVFENMTSLNDEVFQNFLTNSLEGFKSMSQAQQDEIFNSLIPSWNSGIQNMIDSIIGEGGFYNVYEDSFNKITNITNEYEEGLKDLQENAGSNFEDIKNGIDETINSTNDLVTSNKELISNYEDSLESVAKVIEQLEELINKYKEAEEAAKNAAEEAHKYWSQQQKDAANSSSSSSGNSTTNNSNNTSSSNKNSTSNSNNSSKSNGTPEVGETVTYTGGYYYSNSNGTGARGIRGVGKKVRITQILSNKPYPIHVTSSNSAYGWLKKNQLSGFDTGGYTGDWGNSDGRLALLHQKELVLNAKDTKNILNSVNILRNITNNIGQSMLDKISLLGNSNNIIGSSKLNNASSLEQKVSIEAIFPNVTKSYEIENALNNLVNTAAQRVGRR